ncbi:SET domain-containing protein [Biscogniauxia mediterranea]|nr:SET domain-containing protein [Biscogniauxia mediterranea]
MQSLAAMSPTRALSSEASSLGAPADTFSNVASLSSTPPTTVADSMSLASDTSKADNATPIGNSDDTTESIVADEPTKVADSIVFAASTTIEPPESPDLARQDTTESTPSTPATDRARRRRISAPIYNLAKLAGTAIHGKRRSKGDTVSDRKRRTVSGDSLLAPEDENDATTDTVEKSASAGPEDHPDTLKRQSSTRSAKSTKYKTPKDHETPSRRISTRSSGIEAETLAHKISSLGKRGRKTFEKGITKMSRELRRLQDTNEFSGIDTKPVLYTTWANGKYVDPDEVQEPPKKKAKIAEPEQKPEPEPEPPVEEAPVAKKRRTKKWLDRGLYAGQDAPMDIYKGLTPAEKKTLAQLPELMPSGKVNNTFPQPIFNGLRTLIEGRDFKLPFDVCNPLPPGQPKPDEWRKMTKNRFVGDAAAYWKKTPHFKDYQSKCVCTPEDGCGESCQNRIMLYECDSTNCNVGIDLCQNRAFAKLQERTKAGGKFRVGVEVIKTSDRGYGIRANRCFKANQIIMEYTGEIITEEECDRRMNEKYKDNQCYYLMSFDQNMIIDATTGSIARFVNHSCQPNCRMVKWIVSGQPRMALFAGDRDIMTGEELTYDYNFDPFSAKNVQKCLCGAPNCRGVLGPKPKEVKQPKPAKEEAAKSAKKNAKAGKRKLKETVGDEENDGGSATKKRKIKAPTSIKSKGVKTSLSKSGLKAAKGAATVIKRSVSTISVNTKAALSSKSGGKKIAAVRKSKSVVKTYSKAKVQTKLAFPRKSSSAGLTIVAAGTENVKPEERTGSAGSKKSSTPSRSVEKSVAPSSPRKASDLVRSTSKIRLVNSPSAS